MMEKKRNSISALALSLMSKVAQLFRTPSLFLIFNAAKQRRDCIRK